MKRIVNGVTYNTDTSTKLAQTDCEDDDGKDGLDVLYVTQGGAFYLYSRTTEKVWNESERAHEENTSHAFIPMSPERAHAWLMEGDIEVFHNPFDDPPEATAEAEAGATLYIRVPAVLKREVEEAAAAEKVSGNVWAMRCVAKCLQNKSLRNFASLAHIYQIAAQLGAAWSADDKWLADDKKDRKRDAWKLQKAIEALCEIAELAEKQMVELVGNKKAMDDIGPVMMGDPRFEEYNKQFAPYPE